MCARLPQTQLSRISASSAGRLAHQLILDEGAHRHDLPPDQLAERRTAIAENPRIAVVVRRDLGVGVADHAHVADQPLERFGRVRIVRVLDVVIDPVDQRVGFGVLAFEPGHEQAAFAARAHDEGNRALGRDEGESAVVEDVGAVEQHDARQTVDLQVVEQLGAARFVFRLADVQLGNW